MKQPGKFTLVAVAMAAAAGALATAAPATAAAPAAPQVHTFSAAEGDTPPASLIGPNGQKPREWGVVSFKKGAPIQAKVSKGGGTWNYGTSSAGLDGKHCYSNYIHPTKKHSASVAMASGTDKDIREKDIWAKARVTAGAAYTCNAYWGVY
ncbi:lactococcin 972 family bacteriocin [Streptomyces sp. NPDC003006]